MPSPITEKLEHHVKVMFAHKDRLTPAEREHALRHFRGVLSAIGDLAEKELKQSN